MQLTRCQPSATALAACLDPDTPCDLAVGALYGPLHGGANEAVLRMLERIGTKDKVPAFVEGVKNRKEKMFGFGHRCGASLAGVASPFWSLSQWLLHSCLHPSSLACLIGACLLACLLGTCAMQSRGAVTGLRSRPGFALTASHGSWGHTGVLRHPAMVPLLCIAEAAGKKGKCSYSLDLPQSGIGSTPPHHPKLHGDWCHAHL